MKRLLLPPGLLFCCGSGRLVGGEVLTCCTPDDHTWHLYHFEEEANDFEQADDPGNPLPEP